MTSEAAAAFEMAQREEGGLNARQRRILDLIERGHTNREIADQFGMTLDGAKWNVSEILTKLGLGTREDAAEYWRWRRGSLPRRFVRRLGALVGMPVVRWVGVGAGVATVGVVALLALSQGNDSTTPGGVPPFYLEATVSFVDNSDSVGTNIAGASPTPATGELREETLRWWSRDRDHARFEVETTRPAIDAGTTTMVVDGVHQWVYQSSTNSYTKAPMADIPTEIEVRPFALSVFLGPWILKASGVDDVLEQVRGFSQGHGHAEVVGHETLLGRDTTVIEFGPTGARSASSAATATVLGAAPPATLPTPETERYGTGRIYLDVERMFVMGYETADDAQNLRLRVTKLDYDGSVADERVSFNPPPGAREAGADGNNSTGSSGLGGGPRGLTVPAGFLIPRYVPEGYTVARSVSDGTEAFDVTFRDGAGRIFEVQQRMRSDGLPSNLAQGDKVTVHGLDAYLATAGATTTLAWYERGIAVLVSSESLTRGELQAVAAGLRGD